MPLSTSSSEQTQARRGFALLVSLLVLICIAMEIAGSFGYVRASRIQRRIDASYKQALALRPVAVDGRPTLLVLGNSLLLKGLDLSRLRGDVGGRYRVTDFFVEQTGHVDWQFGLRRLFREGSRPSIVVLGLATNHLAVPAVRGEYFAHFLMSPGDIVGVASQLKLDATTASNYFFASLSGWLGGKSEIRKFVLLHTMPDLDKFASVARPVPPHLPDNDTLRKTIAASLLALKQPCDEHGARLIVVIPPTLDQGDPYQIDLAAGIDAGVSVLVPFAPGQLSASEYGDDIHLNAHGATLFTDALAARLLGALNHSTATSRSAVQRFEATMKSEGKPR